ncbi:hypothetical protein Q1695_011290 [Nippostrongylus brasiliensis]|nr:hypothetical protein Q1695_011290 [Nippostrongylus brasiliensis]
MRSALVTILLMMIVDVSESLKCKKINSNTPTKSQEITAKQCGFFMQPPCRALRYTTDAITRVKPGEGCEVTNKGLFTCWCTQPFCASDFDFLISLYKRSKSYKGAKDPYVKCLEDLKLGPKADNKKDGKKRKKSSSDVFSVSTLMVLLLTSFTGLQTIFLQ